jgi:hypothetical protein
MLVTMLLRSDWFCALGVVGHFLGSSSYVLGRAAVAPHTPCTRKHINTLPLFGEADTVERLARHVLVPHFAILAKLLIAVWVVCTWAVALVVASGRRDVGARHAFEPLALLSLFALCALSLRALPWPINRTAAMAAVEPVGRHRRTFRYQMPWLAVDARDTPILFDLALLVELVLVGRVAALRPKVQRPALALRNELLPEAVVPLASLEPLVVRRSQIVAVGRAAVCVWVGTGGVVKRETHALVLLAVNTAWR